MRLIARWPMAFALLLALPGCNRVVSMEPWFTSADAAGVPKMRDGLWVGTGEDCRVNTARPVERWPACAGAMYVRGDERLGLNWDDPDDDGPRRRRIVGWERDPGIIASGDPLIWQLEVEQPTTSETSEPEALDESEWRYMYAALRPTRFDEQSRVVAFEAWAIQCGPMDDSSAAEPSETSDPGDEEEVLDGGFVTDRPFPGLTVVGNDCTADSIEALRGAAVLSEAIGTKSSIRWIRDGWR